jgi:hypothetical protein
MKLSLFRSGPLPRLALAALYAVFAFGAVALVERASARRSTQSAAAQVQSSQAQSPEIAAPLRIEIESVNAVASWTVRLDGVALSPAEKSPTAWSATIDAPASAARLGVDATRGTNAETATNALRLRIARGTTRIDRTFWCSGDCVFDVSLAELAPNAAPAR